MASITAPPDGTGNPVRRAALERHSATVVDLWEYRRRQACDPLAGVRRRIRREMVSKGMRIDALAAKAGLSPVGVAAFFRGETASPREITRMASVLGLSWSLLSGRS